MQKMQHTLYSDSFSHAIILLLSFLVFFYVLYPSLFCIFASPPQLHKHTFFIKCWTALFKVLSKTTVSSKKLELKVMSQNPKYSIYYTFTKRVFHVLI